MRRTNTSGITYSAWPELDRGPGARMAGAHQREGQFQITLAAPQLTTQQHELLRRDEIQVVERDSNRDFARRRRLDRAGAAAAQCTRPDCARRCPRAPRLGPRRVRAPDPRATARSPAAGSRGWLPDHPADSRPRISNRRSRARSRGRSATVSRVPAVRRAVLAGSARAGR